MTFREEGSISYPLSIIQHPLSMIQYPFMIHYPSKNGQTHFWSKHGQKIKVLRMGWPIVENVPTPRGIIFNLFRGP